MKNVIVLIMCAVSVAAGAAETPLWLRNPAISPDGKTIAFSYKGDIYTVPSTGGTAKQITTNAAYDSDPVWSPDGSKIAFASDRAGGLDVYVTSADGGAPMRITTHSAKEHPMSYLNADTVLVTASIQPSMTDRQFPGNTYPQVYAVPLTGGRPVMYSALSMEQVSVNPVDGRILYTDKKGYEDAMRKHHTSAVTRDVWMADRGKHTKMTTYKGENRNGVWASGGKDFYYLSEEDGTFNVYKRSMATGATTQLTKHTMHPVRSLTAANDGTMSYNWNGELYTLKEGGEPQRVDVVINGDVTERDVVNQLRSSGATDIAVSPDGKEVAFVVRGDVYVANVEYGTTKQITDTPQQERDLTFGPDGRSLAYAAERGSTWGIYESKLVRDDDKSFAYAREIKETPLVTGDETSFQPVYSPDGKELAYLKDRTELCVINLKDKKVRTALDGKYNYSYTDGDVDFVWSPDSRWFLTSYIGTGGWNNQDVALVKADGSEVVNLTESGYTDSNPKWVLGGKAMMWESDRAGYRSHGSWGAESDTYIMFFDADAYDEFRMTKEELGLRPEDKKKDKEEAENDSVDEKKKKKKVKPLKFDLDHRRDRVMRLTPSSSFMGDAVLSPKGDKLYYSVYNDGYNLWCRDLKDWSTKLIIRNVGGGAMVTDAKGEQMFVIKSGRVYKVDVAQGATEPVEFEAEFAYRPSQEREYIFNHAWRQVNDKFYDKDIHGIDWKAYHDNYVRFLPHINNNYDFAEMLSEMLGELNGSHTGARYYGPGATKETAVLGAFYDESYTGDGLKVAEVIADGPLTLADSKITAGCVITSIDGKSIRAGEDYYPLLAGKSGKHVLLGVKSVKGKEFEQMVKPISIGEQNNLLYKRWVRKNREQVDAESGGRVAYVHVRGMDSQSFRNTYSELLGRYRNHDAVIVDTRHNGGGWLHDDLVTLLSGKEYARYEPRGQYIGSDPFNKWLKPSCVLICEDNYSNAHGFPWVYKHQGVGKLIGTPVPGTMTAVWWETQIDPSIVFGIPQVTCVASPEGYVLENTQLEPDILVGNTPEDVLSGTDRQISRAVQEMLGK